MTDFKAKMHEIRFRLGLCPRPRWGSLQRSPRPVAGFGRRFAAGGGAGLGKRGERGRGRGREGRYHPHWRRRNLAALLNEWSTAGKVQGTWNESFREWTVQGTNGPRREKSAVFIRLGNESSRERTVQGTNVPGNE